LAIRGVDDTNVQFQWNASLALYEILTNEVIIEIVWALCDLGCYKERVSEFGDSWPEMTARRTSHTSGISNARLLGRNFCTRVGEFGTPFLVLVEQVSFGHLAFTMVGLNFSSTATSLDVTLVRL
jgi:hypothetical protein